MGRIRVSDTSKAKKPCVWRIAVYIRLSKDDGNDESLSVTNQKKIINDFLENSFEDQYTVFDYYVDDGLTGTDYERSGFQQMLRDMDDGKINCIICKNLSRAFRNYSDQGYFLESVFPRNNTRFITISEPKIDTYLNPEVIQNFEVPINGIVNDRFACKTSKDVRETFHTKRRQGEFIGAFAPYGYKKSPENKNHLIIDEEAAQVVKNIFNWFTFDGLSKYGIARRLNERGIPNPTLYKRKQGLQYHNPNVEVNDGLWNSTTISRLLQNEMYVGNMVQGRQRVISYKVHDKISVPKDEWYVVENTHAPLIDKDTFTKAQTLHQRDTRTPPEKKELYLFSGFLRCADCGKALTRKKSKNYVYYSCRTYNEKSKDKCTRHSIREDKLYQAVLLVIQKQIELIDELANIIDVINNAPAVCTQSLQLVQNLKTKQEEYEKLVSVIDNLYIDWKTGEISPDDYYRMKHKFEEKALALKNTIENINAEIEIVSEGVHSDEPCFSSFLKYKNIDKLDRALLVELIKMIYVCDGGEIKIEFTFADKHRRVVEYVENNRKKMINAESKAG